MFVSDGSTVNGTLETNLSVTNDPSVRPVIQTPFDFPELWDFFNLSPMQHHGFFVRVMGS